MADIVPYTPDPDELALSDPAIAAAGQVANTYAAANAFQDHLERKSAATRRAYQADMDTWAQFLRYATNGHSRLTGRQFLEQPNTWAGTTWGLVEAFRRWLLQEGYSIASVNRKLSTIKQIAALAEKAGILTADEARLIGSVRGYNRSDGINVDQERKQRRRGRKKEHWTNLTLAQARQLKRQPDTPQGRRDALLMCLLLDHGLRCSEVAMLQVGDINLAEGTMHFYRKKVKKWQTHELSADTLKAIHAYFQHDALAMDRLLRSSSKTGELLDAGMTTQAINERVRRLGQAIEVEGLSPHDCRHYWITDVVKSGTPIEIAKDAGGWTSISTLLGYLDTAKIANAGIRQSR